MSSSHLFLFARVCLWSVSAYVCPFALALVLVLCCLLHTALLASLVLQSIFASCCPPEIIECSGIHLFIYCVSFLLVFRKEGFCQNDQLLAAFFVYVLFRSFSLLRFFTFSTPNSAHLSLQVALSSAIILLGASISLCFIPSFSNETLQWAVLSFVCSIAMLFFSSSPLKTLFSSLLFSLSHSQCLLSCLAHAVSSRKTSLFKHCAPTCLAVHLRACCNRCSFPPALLPPMIFLLLLFFPL